MDSSWRRPVAAAQVPRLSRGLRRDWDRDRTFGVNCGIFSDIVGDLKRGLTRVSGDQAGVAFSQSCRRQDLASHSTGRKFSGGLVPILLPVGPIALLWGSVCAMTVRVVSFFREIVEILAIERENAAQTGTMEQTESSDWMIWIFQGKSGKQTDSRSSVLIMPVRPLRRLSRLFRCSRFLLNGCQSIARAVARLNHLSAERPLARGIVMISQLSMIAERAG